MGVWILQREDNDTYTLVGPNGVELFTVSLHTLLMLGQMFLDVWEKDNA